MGVRENKVETYLNDQVEKIGGLTRKWVCPSHSGVPDRIVFLKRIILAEVKTVDGILEEHQGREHDRLIAVGVEVVTIYGQAGVNKFILLYKQGFVFTGQKIR